jgi:RNA polymerase sigma-70 factor (ECF subfamily)
LTGNSINDTSPYNEKELFRLIAAGDEKAFDTLFNLFLPRLYPFIIKLTRSEQATQEIIQETFIRVWLNRDKLPEIDNPGGWLFKVTSNECYSYLRKSVSNNKFFNTIDTEPDPVDATHEKVDLKELNRLIGEAVSKLPPQRKKIFQLSREQGKSIPEIAAALNLSPNTVKNALVSSLKFIREYLGKYDVLFLILILPFWKK